MLVGKTLQHSRAYTRTKSASECGSDSAK
jgi:hypothetical protein